MDLPIDEAEAPLSTVTFAVVDLETTGGSPWTCGITEVGALKLKGGECLGTFHTLVNPGVAIPPDVTYLTGITTAMVRPAPLMDAVLPALLEFFGGAVIVGHNIRFDVGFLGAAADRLGYPRPCNRVIDTCILARRLVGDEVRDCKLSTLAEFFDTARRPTHRALDDATATGEVLHRLLERAGSLGVLALDDLMEFPAVRERAALNKLKLTNALPRRPGVYVFRDACGGALFVDAASNLRRQVRSYFADGGNDRRRGGALIRQVRAIDHAVYPHPLEASVQAIRLIRQLAPRYNPPPGKTHSYLKLTLNEQFPRMAVVRAASSEDGCVYIGPLASAADARRVAAAVECALPLRRCAHRPGGAARERCCPPGWAHPCPGRLSPDGYRALVDAAVEALTVRPDRLINALAGKMAGLAAAHRFEEAGVVRDRAAILSGTLDRQRRFGVLCRAGRVVVAVPGEGGAILDGGRLVAAWAEGEAVPAVPDGRETQTAAPLSVELAEEVAVVAHWLDERWDRLKVLEAGAGFDWPQPYLSPFDLGPPSWSRGDRSGAAGRRWDVVA